MSGHDEALSALARDLRRAINWQASGCVDLIYPGSAVDQESASNDTPQRARPPARPQPAPRAVREAPAPRAVREAPAPPQPPTRRQRPAGPAPWKTPIDDLKDGVVSVSPALDAIRADLGDCRRCGLCEGRKSIVFGRGSGEARIVFVGEAPGFHEDRRGVPFVGKAGHLLDKMISAMNVASDEIYITNVLKCRPPNNRDPSPDEVKTCAPFLDRQLEALAPEVIVTLGRFAAHAILGTSGALERIRGQWHQARGIPVMPTFHPAYLLRNPAAKRDAWQDLQLVMEQLHAGG